MRLSETTAKYLGRPDMGCLDLCVFLLRDLGFDMPDAVDGLGVANYRELAAHSMRLAESRLLSRMWYIGSAGSTHYPRLGDFIAVFLPRSGGVFPAVCLGSGHAIASFIRTGVSVFKLDKENRVLICRRLARKEAA
jgi:hypothetical protein